MDDLIPELDFCVVDLETTGYSPQSGAGIIEVGSVRIENGRIDRTFQEMVDPGHDIPPKITQLTGITNDDVRGADPVDDVLDRFFDFRDSAIFIAHNASFDLGFIKHYGPGSIDDTHVDTVTLARRLFDFESNALTELIKEFNLERDDAHRALDDALATAELFLIMAREITEPEDYVRCQLPGVIREKSPYNLQRELEADDVITDENEAKEFIHQLILDSDRAVGINKWAKILTGSRGQNIKKYRDNPGYGRFGDWTQSRVKAILNDMIENGQLRQTEDQYPVLEPVLCESTEPDPLNDSETADRF